MACELALVEACNNAVLYAAPSRAFEKIEVTLFCDETVIETRIHDHTAGFELSKKIQLAEQSSESGRGLFIIQSLMDEVTYINNGDGNTLTMRKARSFPKFDAHDLKLKLAESEQVISEMAEELGSCYESLSAIFRSGTELSKGGNLKSFSQTLCHDLLKITSADWFLLRVAADDGTVLSNYVASEPELHPEPLQLSGTETSSSAELKAASLHKDIWFSRQIPLHENDPLRAMQPASLGLIHPFYFADTLTGTLTLAKKVSERPFTAAHVNIVHTVSDFLAMQIVNARLHEEQLNHRLVTHELEIAQGIQRALLPKQLPKLSGFSLAGFCESARHVGGDFYDVVSINEHSALLIIADVMGKGIPAALFAAVLRSVLRGAPELANQPAALLSRVNRLLHEELSEVEMFITAQLAFVDVRSRELTIASAGHCPALLLGNDDSKPRLISPEGMPLGILCDTHFAEETMLLPHNARLVLHTDGVTESRNPRDEFFGQSRLITWLSDNAPLLRTAEEWKNSLASELRQFQKQIVPRDDQTFLVLAEETF